MVPVVELMEKIPHLLACLKHYLQTVADPSVVSCAEGDCYQQELFLLVHEGSVREVSYP